MDSPIWHQHKLVVYNHDILISPHTVIKTRNMS